MSVTTCKSGVWTVKEIYAKYNGSCLFDCTGYGLWLWGNNNSGQLGQNNTTLYSSPVQIPGYIWCNFSLGSTTGNFSGAIKNDCTLWMWGKNNIGQLGLNNLTCYSSPVQIPGTSWCKLSLGVYISFAQKNDSTLWAWGCGQKGALGQNCIVNVSSPVQIPGTTWCKIDASVVDENVLGLKTDNTLWAWGIDTDGNLAQNILAIRRSSPAQVPGTTWCNITIKGGCFAAAITTDNKLYTWGFNGNGELGQGNTTNRSSPVQVPGTTWSCVGAAQNALLGLKTDGTLWGIGGGGSSMGGVFGDNTSTTKRSSPTQVPGNTWCDLYVGCNYVLALKTNCTLWAWGVNSSGQLGDGTTVNKSSPVQIPGTTWSVMTAGGTDFGGALKFP